jgi:putative DNA primase/helicase
MSVVPLQSRRSSSALEFERGDHVELGRGLVAALRDESPCVSADGQFYSYRSERGVWEAVDKARLSRIVQSFAGVPVGGGAPLKIRASDVTGAIRLAGDQAAQLGFFDDTPSGVAFANAYVRVDADAISLCEHSPEHRARFAYAFAFVAGAVPEMLLNFFEQIWRDDGEDERASKVALIQEYVGVSMLGLATRYQRALVWVGDGGNGKSVAAIVIERCMPLGSVCAIPPQDLGQEYRRALLAGKWLNIVSELPEADILDSESWKSIVAGDATTGREIRKEPFTFRPIAGHIYSANRLPGTADQTQGFWRRLIVVRFGRMFAEHEQDPTLADRIVQAERPAIVSWALAGAQRVLRAGRYTVPTSSAVAVADWQRFSDAVRAFVDERCEQLPVCARVADGKPAMELYGAYRRWAESNGYRPLASNKFGARMKAIGLASTHTEYGSYYPVRLRP